MRSVFLRRNIAHQAAVHQYRGTTSWLVLERPSQLTSHTDKEPAVVLDRIARTESLEKSTGSKFYGASHFLLGEGGGTCHAGQQRHFQVNTRRIALLI